MIKQFIFLSTMLLISTFFNWSVNPTIPLLADEEEPLQVFILAGQSNMAGTSAKFIDKLPAEMQKPQENALFAEFWGDKFLPMMPKNNIGPEVSFGFEMAKSLKSKIAMIKLAVSGSSLEKDWNPNEYDKEKNIGVMYKRLIDYVKGLQVKHKKIKIVGMIWMQGESDSRYHAKTMEQYKTKLETLIDNCRKEFNSPEMLFVCGRVNPPGWPFQKNVREAQESVKKKGYAWIDCDDLELGEDKLHFTVKGQVELGKKFAHSMLALMGKNKNK